MSKDRAVRARVRRRAAGKRVRRHGATAQPRPTVILIPTVMGVSDLEIGFGRQLVELGYNAFVADLFGKEFHGAPRDTMFGEMNRLRSDRAALRRRLLPILELVRGLAEVQDEQLVVAGYCFGGQCALDVARSGADVAAAVASTACSIRRACRRRRSRPRSSPSTAGTIRWSRRTRSSRWAGADRGGLRLADPRLWPCRPRLHQSACERAPDRRRRLQRARRRAVVDQLHQPARGIVRRHG